MFKDDYQAAFSNVTASEETYRRVMNMTKQKKNRSGARMISKALCAAALVSLLVVTASASETVRSWFVSYFQQETEAPMSTEQAAFFEENEQSFDQKITEDGFTMELKYAITDGEIAYICLGLTAPEGVALSETNIEGYAKQKPTLLTDSWSTDFLTDQDGNVFYGYSSIGAVEDYDGLSNTQDLLIQLMADEQNPEHAAFSSNQTWTMRFENLVAKYTNEAYYEELMTGKYQNQENFFFTDEEAALLYPEVTLAEGEWKFTMHFEEPDIQQMELIKEPVQTYTAMGWDEKGDTVYANTVITSFVLRPLSANIRTNDSSYAPDFTADGEIFVILEDGSKVRMESKGGGPGEQDLRAELPVLLDEVNYVLLPDGTKLPAVE